MSPVISEISSDMSASRASRFTGVALGSGATYCLNESNTATSYPALRNSRTTREPMNPAPPVINAFCKELGTLMFLSCLALLTMLSPVNDNYQRLTIA